MDDRDIISISMYIPDRKKKGRGEHDKKIWRIGGKNDEKQIVK